MFPLINNQASAVRLIRVLGSLATIIVVWYLYAGHADAPLVFDDLDFFSGAYVSIYGSEPLLNVSRFWPFASFAHQQQLFGHGFTEMRIGNILLHVLNVLVLQHLVMRLLMTMNGKDPKGDASSTVRHQVVAWCVAAFFALHPVSVYAVAYLVQRSTLMATLFSLLMWLCYLNALQMGKLRWLGLSVICFYFAGFSKQHAVLAPLVPLAMTVLCWRRGRLDWRWLPPAFAAYGIIAAGVVIPSAYLLGTTYEPLLDYLLIGPDWHERLLFLKRVHWMSIQTQCGLFFKYLFLWIWPDPSAMSVDMRERFLTDLASPVHWVGVILFLAYGLGAAIMLWRGCRRKEAVTPLGLAGFGLLVPWSMFLVELMSVRLQEIFVLYRSYPWMIGLMILLAVALDRLAVRWRTMPVVLICIPLLGMTGYAAASRLQTFASEKLLWDDAVRLFEQRREPQVTAERAYNNRGVALAREGRHVEALADYERAIAANPRFYASYQSRGDVQLDLGRYEDAIASYRQVLAIRPTYTKARMGIVRTLEKMERKDEALQELKRACAEKDSWGCFLYERKMNPTADFVFKLNDG